MDMCNKGKLRVLIIDDEIHIGQLIKELINWNSLSMECAGIFDNSMLGFEYIQKYSPEIVITDIRMPQLNGLDLIRKVKELNIESHFIVVSGYREFEYAHKALEYGVEDYILKPVNQDDLEKSLRKLEGEILDRDQLTAMKVELQKNVQETRRIIRRDVLRQIIDEKISNLPQNQGINLTGNFYRAIDIKLDYRNFHKVDTRQDSFTAEKVNEILESILRQNVQELLVCRKENLHIYCLINYDMGKEKELSELLSTCLLRVTEYLRGFDQYVVTFGVGNRVESFGEIRYSIRGAYRAICNRLRLGVERIIYEEKLSATDRKIIETIILSHRDKLLDIRNLFQVDEMASELYKIYGEIDIYSDLDMILYYTLTEKIADLLFDPMELPSDIKNFRERLSCESQHTYRLPQFKNICIAIFTDYLERLKEYAESRALKPIRQAKEYVDMHFSERILLEDVAEVVALNPIYFSALFKKETGENFSQYIVNFRMNKAKELLVSTNDTIAVIAEAVGYKDVKYFSQLFKKSIGVQPAFYRKLHV